MDPYLDPCMGPVGAEIEKSCLNTSLDLSPNWTNWPEPESESEPESDPEYMPMNLRIPEYTNIRESKSPIYEIIPGWQSSTFGITEWSDLPKNAQNYFFRVLHSMKMPSMLYSVWVSHTLHT